MIDTLIVGGGPAGLSAALILGRCRRRVIVCDAGEPRNAVSPAVHGFLTRDGLPPPELRRVAREQLVPYATVTVCDVEVEAVAAANGMSFQARLAGGAQVRARTVLLATGVVDELPDLPGFRELYGQGVWHCPYCDGFELRDRPVAVFGRDRRVVGEARALTTLTSDLVVCCDGAELSVNDVAELSRRGIALRRERVSRLEPRPGGLAVICAGSSPLEVAGLFFASVCRQRSALAASLGCRFTPEGLVETNARQATGVPGLWVAGDATRSVLLAIVAAAEGATAAFEIHKALFEPAPS